MDLSTPSAILASIGNQGYLIIFLLLLIEGPVINYVAAFAASLDIFNPFVIFLIAIAGNVVGDMIYYCIGRFGKKLVIQKYVDSLLNHNKIQKIKEFMKTHPGKTLAVIKLTPPLPAPGLLLAGATEMSFSKFMIFSLIISTGMALFFTLAGYYSGVAFLTVSEYYQYGKFIGAGLIVVIIITWLIIKAILKRVTKKIENI